MSVTDVETLDRKLHEIERAANALRPLGLTLVSVEYDTTWKSAALSEPNLKAHFCRLDSSQALSLFQEGFIDKDHMPGS